MNSLKYASDNLVELLGPVNQSTKAPITAGTCFARLFDDRADSALTVNVSSGLILTVSDASLYAVGHQVLVWLETQAWHDGGLVTATDTGASTVTITNAVPSLARAGSPVCRALGDGAANTYRVTMSFFQDTTPTRGRYDYGFRGTIADTHPMLRLGMPVRIEIELDAGAGARLTEVIRTVVAGGA